MSSADESLALATERASARASFFSWARGMVAVVRKGGRGARVDNVRAVEVMWGSLARTVPSQPNCGQSSDAREHIAPRDLAAVFPWPAPEPRVGGVGQGKLPGTSLLVRTTRQIVEPAARTSKTRRARGASNHSARASVLSRSRPPHAALGTVPAAPPGRVFIATQAWLVNLGRLRRAYHGGTHGPKSWSRQDVDQRPGE